MQEAQYKPDGFFLFINLKPSTANYNFQLSSSWYQGRKFQAALTTGTPVEIFFDGEDELYLQVKSTNSTSGQITFESVSFLPVIPKGAVVLGEAGFATTLKNTMGGVGVSSALLDDVNGLSANTFIRIIRSRSLAAKLGSYATFPADLSLLAIKAVEDTPNEQVLEGVRGRLVSVNSQVLNSTVVGGATLWHVTVPAPSNSVLIFGMEKDLSIFMDKRGNGIFYFPGHWPISSLGIEFSHAGYSPITTQFPFVAGQRNNLVVKLSPN
jgi:hypothetical protein